MFLFVAMRKEILVSIGDENLKEMAEVLGNGTCVRILDELALNDLTVSDIADKLSMKINTVDYNVKKLVRAGLIEKSSHFWSVKGKRMPTYRVVDRRIVISPRRKVAAKFLWALGLTGVFALLIRYNVYGSNLADIGGNNFMDRAVFEAAPKASEVAFDTGIILEKTSFWASLAGWEWFLIGAWSSIVLFFIYALVIEKKSR